jgi:hypothetical protein
VEMRKGKAWWYHRGKKKRKSMKDRQLNRNKG